MTVVSVYLTPDEAETGLTGEEVDAGLTSDGLWNWLSGWGKRIKIILNHDDIDAALSNFPHLVYLSASSGHSNKDVSCVFDELGSDANRKKIAITKSDGLTECYVEVDKWDDANEKAWLWVKVPTVDPDEDTFLWLYYDSAHADNDAHVGDPSDAVVHNVWPATHKLVSHMRNDPDTSHIRDSTVNANDGVKKASGEPAMITTGQIADAQEFDGINDFVDISHSPSLYLDGDFTVIVLTTLEHTVVSWPGVVDKGRQSRTDFWLLGKNTFNQLLWGIGFDDFTFSEQVFPIVTLGEYNLYAFGVEGSEMFMSFNGAAKTSGAFGKTREIGTTRLALGAGNTLASFEWVKMDEIHVISAACSNAWLKATKESLWDHLNNFGVEELLPSRLSVELPMALTSPEVEVKLQ